MRTLDSRQLSRWARRLSEGRPLFAPLAAGPVRRKAIHLPASVVVAAAEDPHGPQAEVLRLTLFPLAFRRRRPHPGIPICGGAWTEGDRLWMDEEEVIARPVRGRGPRLEQLRGAAEVVAAAHAVGVIHLDLKPSHVCTEVGNRVRVLDWDTCVPWRRYRRVHAFGFCGTPLYMAPEQTRGDLRLLGPATDVFQLGLLLWAILHRSPVRRPGASLQDELRRAGEIPVRCSPAVRARWPALAAVCDRATRAAPAGRHSSAFEFGDDLERASAAEG